MTRTIILECDELDYDTIQVEFARRQSFRDKNANFLPDGDSNVAGTIVAEMARFERLPVALEYVEVRMTSRQLDADALVRLIVRAAVAQFRRELAAGQHRVVRLKHGPGKGCGGGNRRRQKSEE